MSQQFENIGMHERILKMHSRERLSLFQRVDFDTILQGLTAAIREGSWPKLHSL